MSEDRKIQQNKHPLKTEKAKQYLTSFERTSHQIITFLYRCIFWVIIPFVILVFVIDGFNISVLAFLGFIFVVFIPIYKQSEKRLLTLIETRMEQEREEQNQPQQIEGEKVSNKVGKVELYSAPAITVNFGANSFLVTITSIFITAAFVWILGWSSIPAIFFTILSVLLLAFSFWLPYSNLVKRQVTFTKNSVEIGNRSIFYRELAKVICDADGTRIEFHLTYTTEDSEVRIEDEYQLETRDFVEKWCERLNIPFSEK